MVEPLVESKTKDYVPFQALVDGMKDSQAVSGLRKPLGASSLYLTSSAAHFYECLTNHAQRAHKNLSVSLPVDRHRQS